RRGVNLDGSCLSLPHPPSAPSPASGRREALATRRDQWEASLSILFAISSVSGPRLRHALLSATDERGADETTAGRRRRDDHGNLVGQLVGQRLLDQQR